MGTKTFEKQQNFVKGVSYLTGPAAIVEGTYRDLVIDTLNWLHYLNDEAIDCSLSGCYQFLQVALYVQTATAYGQTSTYHPHHSASRSRYI